MEKEFVSYELALKLKELGFKERCLTYYGEDKPMIYDGVTIHGWDHNTSFLNWTSRPTFSQAFRWFREKYDLHSLIGIYPNTKEWYSSYQDLNWSGKETLDFNKTEDRSIRFKTYEEGEIACLHKLIELVELKKEK